MGNRRIVLILLANFGAGFLGVIVAMLMTGALRIPSLPSAGLARPGGSPEPAVTAPASTSAPQETATNPQYEAAMQKMLAGRLEDAQDDFLQILLTSGPSVDRRVMQALIRARRQLAHDDPVVLRRQAAGFRQAISQGRESPEGYTPAAMELLAEASVRAATELEGNKSAKRQPLAPETGSAPSSPPKPAPVASAPISSDSSTGSSKPEAQTVQPSPLTVYTVRSKDTLSSIAQRFGVSVRALRELNQLSSDRLRLGQQLRIPGSILAQKLDKAQPTVPPPSQSVATPKTPTPTPEAAAPPSPATVSLPPISATGSFYLVQIGPIDSSDRASEITGQLTLAGFAARTSRREEPVLFRVVSGPLSRQVAERRAVSLTQQGYHPDVNVLADGRAQLDFGTFPSEEGAGAYAQHVRKVGFNAQVMREGGTFYLITLGPYQQPTVDAISSVVATFGAKIQVTPAQ